MPNWCSNELEIRGTEEDLEAIKKQVSKSYIHKGIHTES
jgi:predicted DNA binding CopG/RHH family protein